MHLVYLALAMSILSFIGQFVIAFLYFKEKGRKTCAQTLMLRMSISDAFLCIGQFVAVDFDGRANMKVRCEIFNFLSSSGTLSLSLNCLFMTLFSFMSFTEEQKSLRKLLYYSNFICFLFPLLLSILPILLDPKDIATKYTCYTTELRGTPAIFYLITFYIPLTIFILLSLNYLVQSVQYLRRLKQQKGEQLQIIAAQEIINNMFFYPIIFVFCWGPFIIQRFALMFTHHEIYIWENIFVSTNYSQGWLNAAVYIYNYLKTRYIISTHVRKTYEQQELGNEKPNSSIVSGFLSDYSSSQSKTSKTITTI